MRRSSGIISDSFALRSRAFALGGHVVFYLFACRFGNRLAALSTIGSSLDQQHSLQRQRGTAFGTPQAVRSAKAPARNGKRPANRKRALIE
jgi:hypothetical protein